MSFCIFENSFPMWSMFVQAEHSNAVKRSVFRIVVAKELCVDCISPFVNANVFIASAARGGLYKVLHEMILCLQSRSHSRFEEYICEHLFTIHVHKAVKVAEDKEVMRRIGISISIFIYKLYILKTKIVSMIKLIQSAASVPTTAEEKDAQKYAIGRKPRRRRMLL